MSFACIHDSDKGSGPESYQSFLEPALKNLWPIIEHADMLVSWNGDHFDIPLLNKYYAGDLSKIKSLDLMKEVQLVLGRRLKLDTVAEATLGTKKSGHGLEAIEWWRNGEVDKVVKYCIDDVRITRELYDYAMKNGHLKYRDNGVLKEVKLNTSKWHEYGDHTMNHTLPF